MLALLSLALLCQADERTALLLKAEEGVRAAAGRAEADLDRPTFHVLPPSRWTNDPNGPIYYRGYYHLFYQLNPFGDEWGNMHWGHARSRDLARWDHRPVALWPSKAAGEDHVFSGCATLDGRGRPMIFYTSIGKRLPEQWAATPDDDSLDAWTKSPANPILTEALHGGTKVHEWRDPFVFPHEGRTYMVLGGNLNGSQGGEAVVTAYRAEDDALTEWSYLGVLFRHPDPAVKNIECPLLFPVGDRWVLIVSQGHPVDTFVGDLDGATMRFTPATRGKLDLGQVYAPNVLMNDPKGRRLLWGWIDGFPPGKGWRHCQTLPRVLSIGPDGTLRQRPAPELEALRGASTSRKMTIDDMTSDLTDLRSETLEVVAELDLGTAREAGLRFGDAASITWDGKTLAFADARAPLAATDGKTIRLHAFLDHSVVEVYADDRLCLTKVVQRPPGPVSVGAFARGGRAMFPRFEAWAVRSIWAAGDAGE